jgi:hypothetical protein
MKWRTHKCEIAKWRRRRTGNYYAKSTRLSRLKEWDENYGNWPAGPRDRLQASAVIVETDGFVRSVTLAALADELGCDRSDRETADRQAASLSPFLLN